MSDVKSKNETFKNVEDSLKHLSEANHKIVEFLQSEYKRKLSLQTFIGEAVLYELLCQSYGVPEYTTEESHKRLLSVILGAMKNHQDQPECSLEAIDNLIDIWNRHDDPHSLKMVNPDTGAIRLRKIAENEKEKTTNLTSVAESQIQDHKSFVKSEIPSLTQLWEQPKNMDVFNKAFKNGGRNYVPKKPEPFEFKTYDVQVNGKSVGNFKSDSNSISDKGLQQNALNTALPVIKRRRRKVKKVIRSGTTWNFII